MVNFRRVDPQIKMKIEGKRKKEIMSERTLPHFMITGVLSAEKRERIRSILSAVRLLPFFLLYEGQLSSVRCHINFTFLTLPNLSFSNSLL